MFAAVDKSVVEDLVLSRINKLVQSLDFNCRPSPKTRLISGITPKLLMRYNIIDKEKKGFLVNSWPTIGWVDPFPEDARKENKDQPRSKRQAASVRLLRGASDLAYPESRYLKSYSPYAIYLPSKENMLKMMRACLMCKDSTELWINRI